MNILITTQHGEVAGATYSIFYLAKGLSDKGHKVILALRFDTLLHQMASQAGIDCTHFNFKSKFNLSAWYKISQLCKTYGIQVVYAQESKDRYICIFSRLFFGPKIKLLLARRQMVVDNNSFKRFLYSNLSDGQIVVSQGLKNELVKMDFQATKMKVIFNGLPPIIFNKKEEVTQGLRAKYHLKKNDIVLGCVSRPKRQDDLLAVLNLLPENYKLLLVGITQEQLNQFFLFSFNRHLKSRLIVAGIIQEKVLLYHHYKLMNIHILSSDMDGFGMVTLEAMSMGVPVIGANFGGIPDVIENEVSGLIYDLGNIHQLQSHIIKILSDETIRSGFIKEGFNRVKAFSIEKTVDNHEKFFSEIVNG
ncbi:MAG: glycosyltransferase family 4 protein [Cyclobacteriaceae bacterium]